MSKQCVIIILVLTLALASAPAMAQTGGTVVVLFAVSMSRLLVATMKAADAVRARLIMTGGSACVRELVDAAQPSTSDCSLLQKNLSLVLFCETVLEPAGHGFAADGRLQSRPEFRTTAILDGRRSKYAKTQKKL